MTRLVFALGLPALRTALLLLATSVAVPIAVTAAKVPNLALQDTSGGVHTLSALRGRAVVLSFWATWCGPCREELPRLSRLAATYGGRPVTFVAVSIDEGKNRAKIAPFLLQNGIELETWIGADTDTMSRLGLGDIVPSTVILDAQGQPVVRIEGEAQEQDVRGALDWLLSGRQGAAPPARVKRY